MKKFIAFVIASMMLITVCASAQYSSNDLVNTVNAAIEWKENDASPYYDPASEAADLYIFALKRLGLNYDYTRYSDNLQTVLNAYGANVSAAPYAHAILALQACGVEARDFNNRDYVADGTYQKGNISGVDNWSWALIALDSGDYEVPSWAYDNRDDMVRYIMANQNDDGSFGSGAASTALAIIALDDYTYEDKTYTFVSDITGKDGSMTAMESASRGLDYLSSVQNEWGDYGDLKSTALAIIALDYMDVDIEKDSRFIKNNKTVLDGFMDYKEGDGGFSNSLNGSDSTATSYAICALTSHLRTLQGKGKLFDMHSYDSVDGSFKQVYSTSNSSSNSSSNNSSSSNNNSSSSSNSNNNSSSSSNSNNSSSSSSSSNNNSSSSSSSSSATKAPTISSTSTSKPTKTMSPITSANPRVASTTRPATTMSPITSSTPSTSTSPRRTASPKKQALVGPVEMPGPMMQTPEPTIEPSGSPTKTAASTGRSGLSRSLPLGIAMLALAAIITAAAVTYVVYTSKNVPMMKKKRNNEPRYEAKVHRQTEIHGRYKARERYKERGKYKGSFRK
jgi:hypothetical protein